MRPGFVYILRNPGLAGYKIGQTTRAAENRRSELRREYGTAYPFEIASRHAVNDPAAVEALAHRLLRRYRVPRSELFTCDLATCQRAVLDAARHVVERRWWMRVWDWLTLPRDRGRNVTVGSRKVTWRRRRGDGGAVLVLVCLALMTWLAVAQPELPAWLPRSTLRAALALERMSPPREKW